VRAVCSELVHILNVPENFSLRQISKEKLKEARDLLEKSGLSVIPDLPFHEKIPTINKLYKKGLYYTKRNFENFNTTEKSQAIMDLYNYSLIKEINLNSAHFGDDAEKLLFKEPFYSKVYDRFTKMIPGSSGAIEKL